MSFTSWLQNLRSALGSSRNAPRDEHGAHHAERDGYVKRRRGSLRAGTHRLNVEALEDRLTPSFSPAASFPVGTTPQVVRTADFNNDGRLDLATTNYANDNGTLSVLLGDGQGGFGAASHFAGGVDTSALAVGDFNNDGNLDLVTLGNGLSLRLGNGDGAFQPPVNIGLQNTPGWLLSVAAADFDADGKMDLAITAGDPIGNWPGGYEVLLGDGAGGFAVSDSDFEYGDHPRILAVADVNADGMPDMVMADWWGFVVLLSNGDGTLGYSYSTGGSVRAMAVGDFTGDGILDLVSAGQTVDVLPGNGDGTFASPIPNTVNGVVQTAVAVADFNGDGKLDVITTTGRANTVSVLLGRGDGTLFPPIDHSAGSSAGAVAVGDFNGDGRPDAAVANGGSNAVSVLLNDGIWDGTPPAPQASSFTVSGFPSPTIAGQAGSFTVTALDATGSVISGYTGTVHFTSSDVQASLPTIYTFAAADNGTHTFSATLKTAGTQAISVSDATAGVGGVESGITVNAAAASTMIAASFPATTTAGVAGSLTVTLRDLYGNTANGYRGTVYFTSSDAKASLPANYTFTAADAGVHTFSAILKTAGTQSITAKDTVTGSLRSTDGGIIVNAARASQFIIFAPPSVTVGVGFSLTVTVADAYGNVATGYTGTIHFTSSDGQAKLPANYTFTAADKGMHTFTGLILQKTGKQTITITDALLSFSASVDVLPKKK